LTHEPSEAAARVKRVNEGHMAEIERAMFVVSGARRRLDRTAQMLERDGAEEHLVEALREAERDLDALTLRLMQKTYFAVAKDQLTLT
jgi:hypothetical protein